MQKHYLSEIEIRQIFATKKLKIGNKTYNFPKEAVDKIRKLFKRSKYYE